MRDEHRKERITRLKGRNGERIKIRRSGGDEGRGRRRKDERTNYIELRKMTQMREGLTRIRIYGTARRERQEGGCTVYCRCVTGKYTQTLIYPSHAREEDQR